MPDCGYNCVVTSAPPVIIRRRGELRPEIEIIEESSTSHAQPAPVQSATTGRARMAVAKVHSACLALDTNDTTEHSESRRHASIDRRGRSSQLTPGGVTAKAPGTAVAGRVLRTTGGNTAVSGDIATGVASSRCYRRRIPAAFFTPEFVGVAFSAQRCRLSAGVGRCIPT